MANALASLAGNYVSPGMTQGTRKISPEDQARLEGEQLAEQHALQMGLKRIAPMPQPVNTTMPVSQPVPMQPQPIPAPTQAGPYPTTPQEINLGGPLPGGGFYGGYNDGRGGNAPWGPKGVDVNAQGAPMPAGGWPVKDVLTPQTTTVPTGSPRVVKQPVGKPVRMANPGTSFGYRVSRG